MEALDVAVGSPRVNFTLVNEGQEKLWNFDDFDVIIKYDEISGRSTEELSFNGDCLGGVPPVGTWCIETISEDFLDPGIINEGESARIRSQVNQDLVSGNTIVSVNTDNGAIATLPVTSRSILALGPDPPVACQSGYYGRTFHDTDTGISYICDSTRDKWLSIETIVLWGDETGDCPDGDTPDSDANCNVDWGNGLGPDGSTDLGLYIPYNMTLIAYGFSEDNDACGGSLDVEIWGTGSNSDDNNYSLGDGVVVATGLTGQAHNANNLDSDMAGDQYILWGIRNNCGGDVDDWNVIIYFKWRHD